MSRMHEGIKVLPIEIRGRHGYGVLRGFEFVPAHWRYRLVRAIRDRELLSADPDALLDLRRYVPETFRNTGVIWALGPLATDRPMSTVISGVWTKEGEIGIVQAMFEPHGLSVPAQHSFLVRLPQGQPPAAL